MPLGTNDATLDERPGVWERVHKRCESALRVTAPLLDIEENREARSCLGSAVVAEPIAVQLALIGRNDEASYFFARILQLALSAYENGEGYVYVDPHGSNLFARYMAMRIAALADWVVGGGHRREYLDRMLEHLAAAVAAEQGRSDHLLDSESLGRLLLHLAQLQSWQRVFSEGRRAGVALGGRPWPALCHALSSLAAVKIAATEKPEKARAVIEKLFLEVTIRTRSLDPFDPRLTANDAVSLAEIRAREWGESDPWRVIRSLRWPQFAALPDCGSQ